MIQKLKTIAKIIAIPVAIYMVAIMVAPLLINTEQVETQFAELSDNHYGLILQVQGAPSSTAFPSPAVYFSNVSLVNENGEVLFQIPKLKLGIGWLGLFSKKVSYIEAIHPKISLTGKQLSQLQAKYHTAQENLQGPYRYQLTDAQLKMTGSDEARAYLRDDLLLNHINLSMIVPVAGQSGYLHGEFQWHAKPVVMDVSYQPADQSLEVNISAANIITAHFEGTRTKNSTTFDGETSIDVEDAIMLAQWLTKQSTTTSSEKTQAPEQAQTQPTYPLSISGPAALNHESFTIHRSQAQFKSTPTQLSAYLGWPNYITLALDIQTKDLPLDDMIKAFGNVLLPSTVNTNNYIPPIVQSPIPSHFNFITIIDSKQVNIRQNSYQNLHTTTEIDGHEMIVHNARIQMDGDALLNLGGRLKQLPEGRRFYGRAKLSGKQFNQWLATFEPTAINLPEADFSNFDFDGNLFISRDQLRLSEANLQIGDLAFQGGFATFFDQIPRVEADIRLQDINLDYFRDIWKQHHSNDKSITWVAESGRSFDWLRRLPAVLDFNIQIKNFTFLDTSGSTASTRLYSQPGMLTLHNIDTRMLNNVVTGNIKLDVQNNRPEIDATLTASHFNTNYFDTDDRSQSGSFFNRDAPENRWSEELFDFSVLNSMNGNFNFNIGSLIHAGESFQNFKWQASLEDKTLDIKRLSFTVLGGTFSMNGSLIGGSVPGISTTFSLYDVDLASVMKLMFNYENISGRASVSGVIGASGIHPKAWLEQGEIKLNTAVRGLRIQGLDLQSVIEVAKQARSTQDIINGVNNTLYNGLTELSADGNINIQNGIARTPGIRLSYGRVLGNVQGELNLLKWLLNLTSVWQFPELSSSTIPTLSISVQGELNQLEKRFDTSSLEAFVAKRIVGQ